MNYRTIALVGLRLLAVWLVVLGISHLPSIASLWNATAAGMVPSPIHWVKVGYTAMYIAPFVLGIILWGISPWLARLVSAANEVAPPAAKTTMLVQGAIAIAGLVIVVTALPSLLYTIVNVAYKAARSHQYAVPESYTAYVSVSLWLTLAIRAILVLSGLGMFFGSRRLRDWFHRLRAVNT